MMRAVSRVVAVAVAALLVCCSADTHQEPDVANTGEHNSANRYDVNGHKTRNLDPLGGGHLVREVRETRPLSGLMPYFMPRRYNAYGGKRDPWRAGGDLAKIYSLRKRNFDEIDRSDLNPFIGKRNFDEIDRSDLNPFIGKRNFDEIDRSDLNPFIGKRNFDEIDRTSMPFPYAVKRIYHGYGHNFLETPMEGWRQQGFDKKRLQPDYPMDEIDASYFPIGPSS